jgi:hypothetical protein
VEGRAERHGVDHEIDVLGELKPDDLKEVAGMVGSDRKNLRRVGIGVEVDDGERMVESVEDVAASETPCLCADRWISTSAIS